jgi:hypothetical protein
MMVYKCDVCGKEVTVSDLTVHVGYHGFAFCPTHAAPIILALKEYDLVATVK